MRKKTLKKEAKLWVLRTYQNEQHYKKGIHFDEAFFYDFDKMKIYSAETSRNWLSVFPDLVSMYWQYILNE